MALHVAETVFQHREIVLRDKPTAMLDASPKGSVPILVLSDGTVLDESLDIMKWALPNVDIDVNIVVSIDGSFKFHLDRYKYASRYDDTLKRGDVDLSHRVQAIAALSLLEDRLAKTPFLSGGTLGPNDMASFPFVRQFAAVEPEWWAETDDVTHLQAWLTACIASELFKNIMIKHPIWVENH